MFFYKARSGRLLSEFRNARPTNDNVSPTTGKYCSSHLGIPVPAKDRYLLVNAYYRGGSSVIDFSDTANPVEIAAWALEQARVGDARQLSRHVAGRQGKKVHSYP